MKTNPLLELQRLGQSIWMDFLNHEVIHSGQLKRWINEDGLRGVTSNPAIFEKAINGSGDYDDAIRALATKGRSAEQIYEAIVVEDIKHAADVLRATFEKTEGRDGFVSLEVSPHLAYDTPATIEEGRRLWAAVSRPNLFIKVPATREGLPAIQQLIREGINVNVTLLFGLPRYREVAEACLAGWKGRAADGHTLGDVVSVASFFLSRIDVLIDARLDQIVQAGGGQTDLAKKLRGQTAIACAKIAYRMFREIFEGPQFAALAAQDARPQRLLWASTSTKDPAYSDIKYVEALIGPNTVNTLPRETFEAYRDHGDPALRLPEGLDDARETLAGLPQLGIDLDEATQQLEDDGIRKFQEPFDRLIEGLRAKAVAA